MDLTILSGDNLLWAAAAVMGLMALTVRDTDSKASALGLGVALLILFVGFLVGLWVAAPVGSGAVESLVGSDGVEALLDGAECLAAWRKAG